MHFTFRDVNDAFAHMVRFFSDRPWGCGITRRPSRNGDVLKINEPVTITYKQPTRRVLFNSARDCNPFFHLYECIWMLAGCNDVKRIDHFNSNMKNYSDDGETFHGAYGYRWRNWFGYDQLQVIVDELRKDPNSRRCVLSMWDASAEGDDDKHSRHDLHMATHGGVDIPCNTHAYFDIRCEANHPETGEGYGSQYLDMTVCNRSNDMIWGMFGANVVHFSFLQEVLAGMIGVQVGKYHQVTNNLHVYTDKWEPEKYLSSGQVMTQPPLPINAGKNFLVKCEEFVAQERLAYTDCDYLDYVVIPMVIAFNHHKERNYDEAIASLGNVQCLHWHYAGLDWIVKRKEMWEKKQST